jgi:hypothetical protein
MIVTFGMVMPINDYEKWWKSYSPGGEPIPLSREMIY